MRRRAIHKAPQQEYENPFNLDPGAPIPSLPSNPAWGQNSVTGNGALGAYSVSSPMIPSLPALGDSYRHSSDPSLPPLNQRHSLHVLDENFNIVSNDKVPTGFFDAVSEPQSQPTFAPLLGVHISHYQQQHHPSGSWEEYSSGAAFSSDMASSEDVYPPHSWNDPALTMQIEQGENVTYLSGSNSYVTSNQW
jgi:hypothetical protein